MTLNSRERSILIERRLRDDPVTLDDLSRRFGISRERVRQIEVRAFEKLRDSVRHSHPPGLSSATQLPTPSV